MSYKTYAIPISSLDNISFNSISRTLDDISISHLEKAGLQPNFIVADIGCGDGTIVIKLLTRVKKIYAIDISQKKLDETKENVDMWINNNPNIRLASVEYLCIDITKEIHVLKNMVDIVFVRFVFNNINVNEHNIIVNNLKEILAPQGKLLCEEPVWDNLFCLKYQNIINKFKKFLHEQNKMHHLERNTGLLLPMMFLGNGYKVKFYEVVDRNITSLEFKAMYHFLMKIIMDEMSNEEVVRWQESFEEWNTVIDSMDGDIVIQTAGTGCITVVTDY